MKVIFLLSQLQMGAEQKKIHNNNIKFLRKGKTQKCEFQMNKQAKSSANAALFLRGLHQNKFPKIRVLIIENPSHVGRDCGCFYIWKEFFFGSPLIRWKNNHQNDKATNDDGELFPVHVLATVISYDLLVALRQLKGKSTFSQFALSHQFWFCLYLIYYNID